MRSIEQHWTAKAAATAAGLLLGLSCTSLARPIDEPAAALAARLEVLQLQHLRERADALPGGQPLAMQAPQGEPAPRGLWQRLLDWVPFVGQGRSGQAGERPSLDGAAEACGDVDPAAAEAALVELFAVLRPWSPSGLTAAELDVLSACLLRAGLASATAVVLRDWAQLDQAPARRGRRRLELARLQLSRGDYAGLLESLGDLSGPLSEAQQARRAQLMALAHLALGEPGAAVQLLNQGPHLGLLADFKHPPALRSEYLGMRYNLAMALLAAGRRDEALAVLDSLGRLPAHDSYSRALIDQANLTLGWQFLRAEQGATAGPVFQRVALYGPFSRQALLGLGWSAVIPQGQAQPRAADAVAEGERVDQPVPVLKAMYRTGQISCEQLRRAVDDFQICLRQSEFERRALPAGEGHTTRVAAVPWLELIERGGQDPVLVEAAIGFADRLGEARHAQAVALYQQALDAIESQRQQITGLQGTLAGDAPDGWLRHPALGAWGAGAQPQLLRELIRQSGRLSSQTRNPELAPQFAQLAREAGRQLAGQARAELAARLAALSLYQQDLHFKLARAFDGDADYSGTE